MKIDGRTLSHEILETIRLMAVRRVEEPSEVIKSYGFCRTVIYRWLRKSREEGRGALQSRKATGPEQASRRLDRLFWVLI